MHLLAVRLTESRRVRVGPAAGTWRSLLSHTGLKGPDVGKAVSYGF